MRRWLRNTNVEYTQLSIHAIGMIDRTIYCGAYREGTATVFRRFRIWARG
jgi:hypothetical protein